MRRAAATHVARRGALRAASNPFAPCQRAESAARPLCSPPAPPIRRRSANAGVGRGGRERRYRAHRHLPRSLQPTPAAAGLLLATWSVPLMQPSRAQGPASQPPAESRGAGGLETTAALSLAFILAQVGQRAARSPRLFCPKMMRALGSGSVHNLQARAERRRPARRAREAHDERRGDGGAGRGAAPPRAREACRPFRTHAR